MKLTAPPMGLNTWNTVGENINDELLRCTADKIIELGLKDVGNEYIEIELDEEKTAIENAQRYFALYNKGKKSFIVAKEMSEKTKEEIDYLKQILFDIEICSQYSELQDIAEEFTKEE